MGDKPDKTCSNFTKNYQPSKFMGNMPSSQIKTQEYIEKLKKAQNSILKSN
jgi:hypothetical protein